MAKKKKKNLRKSKDPLGYLATQGRCPDCGETLYERAIAGIPSGHAYACLNLNKKCKVSPSFLRSDIKIKMKEKYDAAAAEQRAAQYASYMKLNEQQNLVVRWIGAHRHGSLNRFEDFSDMVIWIMENPPGTVTPMTPKPMTGSETRAAAAAMLVEEPEDPAVPEAVPTTPPRPPLRSQDPLGELIELTGE